jgi:hypothetical protein
MSLGVWLGSAGSVTGHLSNSARISLGYQR